jgi:hypothetical protein
VRGGGRDWDGEIIVPEREREGERESESRGLGWRGDGAGGRKSKVIDEMIG